MTRFRLAFLLVFAPVALGACGGAAESAAPAKSAAPPPREEPPVPEPRTVEEAQRQIAEAAGELEGRAFKAAESDHMTAPPSEPSGSSKAEDRKPELEPPRCVSPCRALASMKRAVEALCRMTGEADSKCVEAKKTLADSVGKTATCKCGG